jgi:tetratricopeptide (TPR) repeat protein
MKVEELKEKARRHELREEWQKAFDLYRTALRIQDEDEPPDITLFNRLGDIQTRLGQINGAVEQYERAIELYLEAELPNNAIAICKKVLRNLPDRSIFFLRMGQIRAGQGFLTDARQNFLTYAERQTVRGDIESALNALVEFVGSSPEDVEIRQSLASQLESHGRTVEAIEQYTEVYRLMISADEDEAAMEVSEKLGELAPDLVLPDPESIRAELAVPETEVLVLESTSLGGLELDDWEGDESTGFEGVEVELGATDEGVGEEEEPEAEAEEEGEDALPTFDFDSEDAAEDAEVLSSFEFGETEAGDLEADDDSLPLIGFGEEEGEDVAEESLPLVEFQEVDELEPIEEDSLPLLGLEEEEEQLLVDELPIEAALEDAAFEAAREDLEEPEAVELEPVDPDAAASPGDHKEAADGGDMGLAIERVQALIETEPDNVELYQRLVEYAFRKNDQDVLVSAYMELAGCLARTGAPMKAKAVYQQVLSLSSGHEGATTGIEGLDGAPGARPPAQVASSEEYVDLGSMILGDEIEKTTRWKVAAEAPSGDDEADFAKMLGQFKEKVSEHVAADDVTAHHDLGTAYMEMGLFEEAVSEFQMALRASPNHLPTHEVMGRCWMEMGKSDMAVRALNRALNAPFEVEDELIGIYYLMALAQEDQGNNDQALEFYEKVFSLDINFEDVTERLRALR